METSRNRIKQMTELLHITQKELAQKAHVRESSISNYVNGVSEPGQKTIKKIADTFHMSPAWLMGYDNTDPFGWDTSMLEKYKITDFDEMLIAAYHDASKSTQKTINILLDLEDPENKGE